MYLVEIGLGIRGKIKVVEIEIGIERGNKLGQRFGGSKENDSTKSTTGFGR